MNTPVADFLRRYEASAMARFHMPGHKGNGELGCEGWDITEVQGADSLYEADGIIAESEANATKLFGSGRTVYSTEGSSQCIRAMLHLALRNRTPGTAPVVVAARNVHKAFIYAAALLDFEVVWLWPEENRSLCDCVVEPERLEKILSTLSEPPAAVYVTSPNYLGGMAPIQDLAEVCHRHGTILAVDNAHGAYLHFLPEPIHPLDLGADLCCDSAHKTLPVLTGGAYLHISSRMPREVQNQAKAAMALFGSTSPSYLILASLDLCNRALAEEYPQRLSETVELLTQTRVALERLGWGVENSDPLRLTIEAPSESSGEKLAEKLRLANMECEYAEEDFLVLMLTPENNPKEIARLVEILGKNPAGRKKAASLPLARGEQICSIRHALFSPSETVVTEQALGRICAAPTVACPPAIPIAVSGERIEKEALALFKHYGVREIDVLK